MTAATAAIASMARVAWTLDTDDSISDPKWEFFSKNSFS